MSIVVSLSLSVAVYAVPVTPAGLAKSTLGLISLPVLLSLCSASVNVNVPLPLLLLNVPPVPATVTVALLVSLNPVIGCVINSSVCF